MTVSPPSITIYPGQQNVPITVAVGSSSYSGPVTVTVSGLPSGISVSPLQLMPGTSGTLNLSASVAAAQELFPPDGPAPATSATNPIHVIAAAGSTRSSVPLSLTVAISNPTFAPAPSDIDLPIVRIDTGGAPVIGKVTDVPGTITITSADGQTSYLPNASDSDNTAAFHVHGESTASMPKLPYHVKLNTSLDLLYLMGLACPYVTSGKNSPACDKSKSFILLANYDDKTLLRDWAASALANAIPIGGGYLNSPANSPSPSGTATLMPWAPHSLFVELYLNGVYEGNYQLIEEIKADSHRLNITELKQSDTAPADITGGYLMEIDRHENEAYVFFTPQGLPIGLIDPDFTPDPEVPAQTAYIANYLTSAENSLFSGQFMDPVLGWRAYFDEASAINFYIVNEVMGNVDGGDFYSSNYLYKDANNPLIYMGPVWDFDISAGNVNYETIASPVVPWMQENAVWYQQWFTDPGFQADVAAQWNALQKNGVFHAWLASIRQQAARLQQSQLHNFGRWPMQGLEVWPNPEAARSYAAEVAYLTNWLGLRIAYLDSLFNRKAQTSVLLEPLPATAGTGSPVALSAQASGGTGLSGSVSFLSNGVVLGSAPLDSAGAASLIIGGLPPGTANLQAVYSGDSQNALSMSASQNVQAAPLPAGTVTSVGMGSGGGAFTASVTANSGTSVPTGSITFGVDQTAAATVLLDSTGAASYTAAGLAGGSHTITAVYSGDATYSSSSGSLVLTGATAAAAAVLPAISGVVNAASEAQAIPQVAAPGSYLTIYGTGLSGLGNPAASALPLTASLNGTQVTLGGTPLLLLYASATQVNALVPQDLAPGSSYPLVVTVGEAQSRPLNVAVTELQPAIYTVDFSGSGAGVVAQSQSGVEISAANPARISDYLTLYGTGLGALSPTSGQAPPPDGAAAPTSPTFQTVSTVTATIGGISAPVSFAGLAPGFASLYQVNLQVPQGVPSGDSVALILTVTDPLTGAATPSNVVMVAIR